MCDLKLRSAAHKLKESCEQGDIRAGKSIDGLPVVADCDHLCIRYLGEPFSQVEPLAGDILELVYDYVFIRQLDMLFFDLGQIEMRVVYHIRKVDLVRLA